MGNLNAGVMPMMTGGAIDKDLEKTEEAPSRRGEIDSDRIVAWGKVQLRQAVWCQGVGVGGQMVLGEPAWAGRMAQEKTEVQL